MGAQQVESANAILPGMPKTSDVAVIVCHQKCVAIAQRAPPAELALAGLQRVRPRPEQRGVCLPIRGHVDPSNRWNVFERSFAELDHFSRRCPCNTRS